MRKELPQQLLRELLKNSKRSDRELAKVLGVSQPTIARARHKLEREGVIQDYTVVPDFKKMGFEIMTIGLVKVRPEAITPESIAKAKEYAEKLPHAIFSSLGEGRGFNGIVISFHRNYTEFYRRMNLFRVAWKDFLERIEFFVIALWRRRIQEIFSNILEGYAALAPHFLRHDCIIYSLCVRFSNFI